MMHTNFKRKLPWLLQLLVQVLSLRYATQPVQVLSWVKQEVEDWLQKEKQPKEAAAAELWPLDSGSFSLHL